MGIAKTGLKHGHGAHPVGKVVHDDGERDDESELDIGSKPCADRNSVEHAVHNHTSSTDIGTRMPMILMKIVCAGFHRLFVRMEVMGVKGESFVNDVKEEDGKESARGDVLDGNAIHSSLGNTLWQQIQERHP